jgi:hypothetical protein
VPLFSSNEFFLERMNNIDMLRDGNEENVLEREIGAYFRSQVCVFLGLHLGRVFQRGSSIKKYNI